jgi:hypothetical protein
MHTCAKFIGTFSIEKFSNARRLNSRIRRDAAELDGFRLCFLAFKRAALNAFIEHEMPLLNMMGLDGFTNRLSRKLLEYFSRRTSRRRGKQKAGRDPQPLGCDRPRTAEPREPPSGIAILLNPSPMATQPRRVAFRALIRGTNSTSEKLLRYRQQIGRTRELHISLPFSMVTPGLG